jgi:uncharacterized protein YjbJ (UPF0337 family)
MADTSRKDELKGRAKEAAGALTDDDELRQEGRIEQAAGKVKKKAEEVVDKAKEKLLGGDESKSSQGQN